jgi:OmcA/MtrC family decaheme c-type cytochrome
VTPGTYCLLVYHTPKTGIAGLTNWAGLGFTTFQVGTATVEKKIAGSCMDCHSSTPFHLYEKIGEPAMSAHVHPAMFDADQCKACHDYGHPNTGDMFKNQGGTSLNGWSGYGAMPISRRVHGVHFAHYLEHSEEIYANATKDTFGGIIFPQDVRNCTKCHSESDTWKQKPSRIACLACHDSDDAKAHGRLMTYIPDPSDPFGPSAQESCEVCHGAGAEFSADKVHSISNPYVPPYPRE